MGITFDKPRRGEGTQTGASVVPPPESSKGTLALKGRQRAVWHGVLPCDVLQPLQGLMGTGCTARGGMLRSPPSV